MTKKSTTMKHIKQLPKFYKNRKKLTDEMNLRIRTAKPLEKNTFVLVTNQQQVDGVSKKLLPLKTGPYLIIDNPTETTYILKDNNKEQITIHTNHIVSQRKTYKIRTTKLSR